MDPGRKKIYKNFKSVKIAIFQNGGQNPDYQIKEAAASIGY